MKAIVLQGALLTHMQQSPCLPCDHLAYVVPQQLLESTSTTQQPQQPLT